MATTPCYRCSTPVSGMPRGSAPVVTPYGYASVLCAGCNHEAILDREDAAREAWDSRYDGSEW